MVKIDVNWGLVVGKLVSIADNETQIVGTTKKCVTNSVVGCYAFCTFYTLLHNERFLVILNQID